MCHIPQPVKNRINTGLFASKYLQIWALSSITHPLIHMAIWMFQNIDKICFEDQHSTFLLLPKTEYCQELLWKNPSSLHKTKYREKKKMLEDCVNPISIWNSTGLWAPNYSTSQKDLKIWASLSPHSLLIVLHIKLETVKELTYLKRFHIESGLGWRKESYSVNVGEVIKFWLFFFLSTAMFFDHYILFHGIPEVIVKLPFPPLSLST